MNYTRATSSHLAQALQEGTEVVFENGLFSWQAVSSFGTTITVSATIPEMRNILQDALKYAHLEDQGQAARDWLNGLIDGDQCNHALGRIINRRDRWEHTAGLLGETSVHVFEALVVLSQDWTDASEWPALTYHAGEQVWVRCAQPFEERV